MAEAKPIYDEAMALMDKRKYAEACVKLEQVVRLVPEGIGAKFTLGECYEDADRLASAWETFRVVEGEAEKAGQKDRLTRARVRREALEPKLAKLAIEVPERARGLSDLVILRDGIKVERAQWGAAVPVDKGRHVVVATSGKARFEEAVDIAKNGLTTTVIIRGIDEAAAPGSGSGAGPADGGFGVQRAAGIAVLGAGALGVGIGAFFGVRAIQKNDASNADSHCIQENRCDDAGYALREQSLTAATISTVLFVGGGAALAGGAALLIFAPKRAPAGASVAFGPGSIAVRGLW